MVGVAVKYWVLTADNPSSIPSYYGYTTQYGREYYEWIDIKAKRILKYLNYIYRKRIPLDKQNLAEAIYVERLLGIGTPTHVRHPKILWKPINQAFTNHKPSPFIKNFINHLINWLTNNKYLNPTTLKLHRKPTYIELTYSCLFAIWKEHPSPP